MELVRSEKKNWQKGTDGYVDKWTDIPLDQACSTSYVMRSTSAKCGLNAGNVKFNTLDYECINMRIIIRIIAPLCLHSMCNKNPLKIAGKFYLKKNSQPRIWCSTCLQDKLLMQCMYVCINQQLRVFKIASAFYFGFAKGRAFPLSPLTT